MRWMHVKLIRVNYYHDYFTCQNKKGMVLYPPVPPQLEIRNSPIFRITYTTTPPR